jgi:hypothetical protein
VADAELRWYENQFREISKVYEWRRSTGFVELNPARLVR